MDITYHMVPKTYYDAQSISADYFPAEFSKDGFIHCTDGEFMVSGIAYNIFKKLNDELLVLFIDKERVKSKIQYDDPENLYPHIYGPLNREAVVKVIKMIRDRKGDWIFPVSEMPK
ncbi:MAG: DUF952 domain-containing protein [Pseudobdellovibrionaceae bacterium]